MSSERDSSTWEDAAWNTCITATWLVKYTAGPSRRKVCLDISPENKKISDNMARGEQRRHNAPEPAAMRDAMPSSTGEGDEVWAADRGATDTVSETTLMNSEDDM